MKNILQKISPIFPFIALALCCFAFFSLYGEINSNKSTYENNENTWRQEAERRNGIKLLNNSISKIQNEKDLLETHFAQSSNIVPFLDLLEATGGKVGIKAQVASVDISKDGKNLIVEMNLSGSFEGIYRFILLMENFPYELEFISTDIQKEGTEGVVINKGQKWTADIKMKLLSFIP